jgi:hypothetical protein
MVGQHLAAPLVGLALPHDAHTGPLQPEVDPADTGEEAADIKMFCRHFLDKTPANTFGLSLASKLRLI